MAITVRRGRTMDTRRCKEVWRSSRRTRSPPVRQCLSGNPMRLRFVLLHLTFAFVPFAFAAEPCFRGFVAPDRIVTAPGVTSAAYGDFNEDGRVDVVYTAFSYSLYVALNRGSGVFERVHSESLGFPFSFERLATATDVDKDGHLDVLFGQSTLTSWA